MPDNNEQVINPENQSEQALQEQAAELEARLKEIHRMQEARNAQEFSDFKVNEAEQRNNINFGPKPEPVEPKIPGITHPVQEMPAAPQNPVAELNASLKRGQESVAINIIDGKIQKDPADMVNIVEGLMASNDTEHDQAA